MAVSKYRIQDKDIIDLAKIIDNVTTDGRRYCSSKDFRVSCRNCPYNNDSATCSSTFIAEKLIKIYKK